MLSKYCFTQKIKIMKKNNWLIITALVGIAGLFTAYQSANFTVNTLSMENQQMQHDTTQVKVVSIVKVKAPWYAFQFVLKGKFKDAIPDYQKIDGLQFKAFSTIDTEQGKFFGGIYLWENQQVAENWFTPAWHEKVKTKIGSAANLSYYHVKRDVLFVKEGFDYRKNENNSVSIFIHQIDEEVTKKAINQNEGLLRTYLVEEGFESKKGAILLFINEENATQFIKANQLKQVEIFLTPVLLNNQSKVIQ